MAGRAPGRCGLVWNCLANTWTFLAPNPPNRPQLPLQADKPSSSASASPPWARRSAGSRRASAPARRTPARPSSRHRGIEGSRGESRRDVRRHQTNTPGPEQSKLRGRSLIFRWTLAKNGRSIAKRSTMCVSPPLASAPHSPCPSLARIPTIHHKRNLAKVIDACA